MQFTACTVDTAVADRNWASLHLSHSMSVSMKRVRERRQRGKKTEKVTGNDEQECREKKLSCTLHDETSALIIYRFIDHSSENFLKAHKLLLSHLGTRGRSNPAINELTKWRHAVGVILTVESLRLEKTTGLR